MTTDRVEAVRRGQSPRKTSTKHPYAAIEHRVIDSPAFADCKPTAQVLLLLIARQLTRDNNGHLHAAFKWCQKYGIGSEHTLRNAIAELIGHGFIYRTRSHGANGAWARYAVTWLPIKNKDGLFLAGFEPYAWRDWQPSDKKSTRQKVLDQSGRKCSFTPENPAETAGSRGAETAGNELIPRSNVVERVLEPQSTLKTQREAHAPKLGDWIPGYVDRLAARGLAEFCPVATARYPAPTKRGARA